MKRAEKFFDREVEPPAICGNCDYYSPGPKGGKRCNNTRSTNYTIQTMPDDSCGRFFPCCKRWPEADHG